MIRTPSPGENEEPKILESVSAENAAPKHSMTSLLTSTTSSVNNNKKTAKNNFSGAGESSQKMKTVNAPPPKLRDSLTSTSDLAMPTHACSARHFYGRKKELQRLQELYHRANISDPNDPQDEKRPCKRAVMVAGNSGTGKTIFVREFLKQLRREDDSHSSSVLIVSGKYEEMHQTEPFSALEQAFGECIHSLKTQNPDLPRVILEAIGQEGRALLSGIIPAINTLYVMQDSPALASEGHPNNVYNNNQQHELPTNANSFSSNRLHYLFTKFVAALTAATNKSNPRRLLLVLDDIQWADPASLELLSYLLTASIPNVFVLETYRTDHARAECPPPPAPASSNDISCCTYSSNSIMMDRDHDQRQRISKWLALHQEHTETIHLGNHSPSDIGEFLLQEVGCDCPRLLNAIYDRTRGHFFFTMQVVDELLRTGLIVAHHPSMQAALEYKRYCEANGESILQAVSKCASNFRSAKDAVSEKLQRLSSPLLRRSLIVASHLGSQFNFGILHQLLIYLTNVEPEQEPPSQQSLNKALDEAVLEGLLINHVGSDSYRFAHDGIQEVSRSLVPAGLRRDQLLFDIGTFLQTTAQKPDIGEEWMMFVAARHWTSVAASATIKMDPVALTALNLHCGTQSRSMAALEQAAIYLRRGAEALSVVLVPWETQYQLTFQLYQSLAEMELVLGNYETGYALAHQVLDHANSFMEKVSIYHAMDYALGMQERQHDALTIDLRVLSELDIVPGTMTGLRDLMQLRQFVKTHTNADILAFSNVRNHKKLIGIRFLANAAVRAYCTGKALLSVSCIIRQTKMAFKYGLCSEVALAFAMYGSILAGHLGDPTTGRRMGKLARAIVGDPQYKSFECETLFIVAAFIDPWCEPFAEVIETFGRAHSVGLAAGNHAYGYGAWHEKINTSFIAGVPLPQIADSFCEAMASIGHYNLLAIQRVLEPLGVAIFHLLGRRGEAGGVVVDGANPDWDELEKMEDMLEDSSNHLPSAWQYFFCMILAFYLGEMEVADRMSKKFNTIKSGDSYAFVSLGAFYSGLVNVEMYRRTGRRKFKVRAQTFTNKLGKSVKAGGVNNTHKYHLMQAELMGAFRTHSRVKVKEMYDRSIIEAAEMGCIQDEALANELAGEYFLKREQTFWSKDYFAKAFILYKQWGAQAKLNLMLEKRGVYIDQSKLKAVMTASVKSALRHAEEREDDQLFSIQSTIRVGTDDLAGDDMSGLTPIGELTAYNDTSSQSTSRWESFTGVTLPRKLSSPPKIPTRSGPEAPPPLKLPAPPQMPQRTGSM